ncbi:MFS transporter [Sphingomonas sp. DBB INV C78]
MAALFIAGHATFSLVFCIQPLLPDLVGTFRIGAAESALALSLTTAALALAILLSGMIAEMVDRRRMMLGAMLGAGLVGMAGSLATDWHLFLASRLLEGLLLGGMPAVALAYVAVEVDPRDVGRASAIFIAGTGLGAMMGRVGAGIIADQASWRLALAVIGGLTVLGAMLFGILLPQPVHRPRGNGLNLRRHLKAWKSHLAHRRLCLLLLQGFVLGGVFVTFFNFIGFVLMAPPFNLTQTVISLILFVYAFGIVASIVAGEVSARFGQARPLAAGMLVMMAGIALSTAASLPVVIGGIIILTIGFFVGHAIASGWVGQVARHDRGHATSLYLLSYYGGASLMGWVGGKLWDGGGWTPVALASLALAALGLLLAALAMRWRAAAG